MIVIKQKKLIKWLEKTVKTTNLVAPKRVSGVLLYRPISSINEIVWDCVRPVLSAKEHFFPPTERLFTIEISGQHIKLTENIPNKKLVLFGIRPCDARGLKALDALFIENQPVDVNYLERRRNAVVISVACDEMRDTCFCTSTGGAPDDPSGSDILLRKFGGGYIVQAVTEKGKEIVKNEWETEKDSVSINNIESPFYTLDPIPPLDAWPPQFDDTYWAEMSERCISCRICAYVCPTCRCFDLRDEPVQSNNGAGTYERLRCWDSCAGEVYRKIAGGHNPRAEKSQRLRNRFYCKFYYYPVKYETLACTGCGRCIDSCPVNIDITEVLDHIREYVG